MTPDTKFLLEEMEKLFAKQNTKWDQRLSSRGGSSAHAASTEQPASPTPSSTSQSASSTAAPTTSSGAATAVLPIDAGQGPIMYIPVDSKYILASDASASYDAAATSAADLAVDCVQCGSVDTELVIAPSEKLFHTTSTGLYIDVAPSNTASCVHNMCSMYCRSGVTSMPTTTLHSSTPTWVPAEAVNIFDKQPWPPPSQAPVFSNQGMHKLLVAILLDAKPDVIWSKSPWPPPPQWLIQGTGGQLRPIPWPSFGYWNVHCAHCQHNKNDRNSGLWIVWKIPWLFSVLVCWNSESLAAVIVITRAHMLFQYLSTLHRPISIPCDDGIFRWPQTQIIGDFVPAHRGSNLQTGYYCLSNILSRFYTWRFELVQYETLMPSQMNVQFKTLGPPPDWTWSSGCEDNDAFIQRTGVGLWPIIIQMFQLMCITFGTITTTTRHMLTSLSLVISMDRCMMQSLSCEFSLKSHHDTNTTNGGYAAGSKEVLAWEISIAPHYNSNMRISIAIICSVLLDYGELIRQHPDGDGSFSLYPFLLVKFSHKHWQGLLAASFEEIKLQYVRSIRSLQVPWDPGGVEIKHRLGGKPILKNGGMLGMCLWTGYRQRKNTGLQLYWAMRKRKLVVFLVPVCTYSGPAHVIVVELSIVATLGERRGELSIIMYQTLSSW